MCTDEGCCSDLAVCVVRLFIEAVTRRSPQSTVPVSPSQRRHQSSYERPQLPDYELAVQQLNERRQQLAAAVKHSHVHSFDSSPAQPD